ncbi:MAG: hypothetical protein DMG54_13565 [Acidobacteria bacterium]|nr:MAG: hypothetical protein DMG54_13565 [Acidobacteriota bacterium]PYU47261.1 MAG: hypothetical protein DMG53_09510 [Acidobacteriota bacterium]PYU75161.1 MAG: hypothetical protein DMG52_08285 [Acidobacteriota bacterium]
MLPQNYKESSYPVAVYRWHSENPTSKLATVSIMLSWTNMGGWFRTYTHDFEAVLNQGNQNHFRMETVPASAAVKGVVFGGSRADNVVNEWDGEFTIAALESPGVEVFHHTEFLADGDGKAVWAPFSKHGTLANSDTEWSNSRQKPYIQDESKPAWYRGMLFNELYTLKDGGTFWGRQLNSDRNAPATLALLECFGYKLRASSSSP